MGKENLNDSVKLKISLIITTIVLSIVIYTGLTWISQNYVEVPSDYELTKEIYQGIILDGESILNFSREYQRDGEYLYEIDTEKAYYRVVTKDGVVKTHTRIEN